NRPDLIYSANVPANPAPPAAPNSPLLTLSTNFDGVLITNNELAATDARFQFNSFASSNITTTIYNSQWAEVGYFLQPTGETAGGYPSGTPLYALYRCQFVVVPDNSNVNWQQPGTPPSVVVPVPGSAANQTLYQGMSFSLANGVIYFNSPSD